MSNDHTAARGLARETLAGAGETPPTRRGAPTARRGRGDRQVWLYVIPVRAVFLFLFAGPLISTAWPALHVTTSYHLGEFSVTHSLRKLFPQP